MDERLYLITMAISRYNAQFNFNLKAEDMDIRSLETRVNFDKSYEVFTTRLDDFLRLHMHLTFDKTDAIGPYRLESDESHVVDALGDEVFVSVGTIDSYYRDSGMFRFGKLVPDESTWPIILQENGFPMYAEDGEFFLLEDQPA